MLSEKDLSSAYLPATKYRKKNLFKTKFNNSDLRRSNFQDAYLCDADFTEAKLDGINVTSAIYNDNTKGLDRHKSTMKTIDQKLIEYLTFENKLEIINEIRKLIEFGADKNLLANATNLENISLAFMDLSQVSGLGLKLRRAMYNNKTKFHSDVTGAQKVTAINLDNLLFESIKDNDESTMEDLIDLGADVLTKDSNLDTILTHAVTQNNLEIIKAIIRKKAVDLNFINHKTKEKKTALHLAIESHNAMKEDQQTNNQNIITYLISVGANIEDSDLRNTNLEGLNLQNINAKGANFTGLYLLRTDLRQAKVEGTMFNSKTKLPTLTLEQKNSMIDLDKKVKEEIEKNSINITETNKLIALVGELIGLNLAYKNLSGLVVPNHTDIKEAMFNSKTKLPTLTIEQKNPMIDLDKKLIESIDSNNTNDVNKYIDLGADVENDSKALLYVIQSKNQPIITILINKKAYLFEVNLEGKYLSSLNLSNVDAIKAIFSGANIEGTDFTNAKLTGALFVGAKRNASTKFTLGALSEPQNNQFLIPYRAPYKVDFIDLEDFVSTIDLELIKY